MSAARPRSGGPAHNTATDSEACHTPHPSKELFSYLHRLPSRKASSRRHPLETKVLTTVAAAVNRSCRVHD